MSNLIIGDCHCSHCHIMCFVDKGMEIYEKEFVYCIETRHSEDKMLLMVVVLTGLLKNGKLVSTIQQ